MNKGNLSYGLNARSGKGGTTKKKKGLSGFGGDDDSSDDDNTKSNNTLSGGTNNSNARSSINKEIADSALRKRAQSAMANAHHIIGYKCIRL